MTRSQRIVRRALQHCGRVEAWLAWFCLGVRSGSVTDWERRRNREDFLRSGPLLTQTCVSWTIAIALGSYVAGRSAVFPLVIFVLWLWAIKLAQIVMVARRRRMVRNMWR